MVTQAMKEPLGGPPPRIVVCRRLPPGAQATLQALTAKNRILVDQWDSCEAAMPRSELLARARGAAGLLVMITEAVDDELLAAAGDSLLVVSTMSVGFDHIDLQACAKRHVKVCNTPDVLTDATAEVAVGLVIAASRRFAEAQAAVRDGKCGPWNPLWMCGSQISGKTVGIVGLGRIGVAVAERISSFKIARFLYTGLRQKPDAARAVRAEFTDLVDLLESSDIVIVTCNLTESTCKIFNAKTFAKMKPGSILINVARGAIVDHDSLADALRSGTGLIAAGLDVTDPEPLPPSHPLISDPAIASKCIVLPHIGSATHDTREAMADFALSQLVEHLHVHM